MGLTADLFEDADLSGGFAVWLASKEAAFLHGRIVWATWDVQELASGDVRKRIDEDYYFLRVGWSWQTPFLSSSHSLSISPIFLFFSHFGCVLAAMTMFESLSNFGNGLDRQVIVASSTAFALGLILRGFLLTGKGAHVVPSPKTTLLPRLSPDQIASLPYPPDSLPGARDVPSPYGTIRTYEFGPEDGRKVLLVHGISTPCLALGAVAQGLVDKGCRVCLFDLFGRGYSENPGDLPHDLRLFTSQILLVLASSPLSWTGPNKFSIVGYSLGGGISAGFTSFFPNLIESLVLISPSGLIRARHFSKTNRIIYSEGVIPEPLLLRAVKRRLKTPLYPPKKQPKEDKVGAASAVKAEAKTESNAQASLSKTYPNVTIDKAVVHQVDNHPAFVSAFMSSIRYGPIQSQHTLWQRIGKRLSQENSASGGNRKVLIVTGDRDPIIDRKELQEDAPAVFDGNVEFSIIDAAHDLPIVKSVDVVEALWRFWA